MTGFSPAERAALDRATVPAMRPGLTTDIVAAASAGRLPMRRTARGGWRRQGRVLLGVGALLVASATAAATGLLDRLPIRIPGITHVAAAPEPARPKIAHAVRPRAKPAEAAPAVALAAPPLVPAPAPAAAVNWQRQRQRRAALIAAGIPPALAKRPMIARALAEQAGGPPAARRAAAIAEWRRLKALPPAERKVAVEKVRADFLARHPRMAQQYEKRLEARSIAAAGNGGGDTIAAVPPPGPQAAPPNPRAAADRQPWRQWRIARRAWRLRNGANRSPPAITPEGSSPP